MESHYGPPAPGVVDGPVPTSKLHNPMPNVGDQNADLKAGWFKLNSNRVRMLTGKEVANINDAFVALKGKVADLKKKTVTWRNLNDQAEAKGLIASLQEVDPEFNTEQYNRIVENPFKAVRGEDAVSTFSIDVDTASYSNTRRYLNQGFLPPPDAVRIEELVNYFDYDYAPPTDDVPFSSNIEVAECPWDPAHRLVRVGLKGRTVEKDKRPATNLVFLIDVSGSMNEPNKLPLVQESLRMLVGQLGENDKVAIVVYAGNSGLVLPSTNGNNKHKILDVLDGLAAGGSTNGGEGIMLAYKTATDAFIKGGVNRVILCTDGDWNVGVTNQGDLTRLIEEKAKSGVFLSVLGFGMGNLKDATMEQLADKGNGHYGYIDTAKEAKKMFVEQLSGTLVTIAKDVKIQVEFNPAAAGAYRLIGYENRLLAREDFNDDKKDAGEIGAGHTVTALYEVVPAELVADQESKNAEVKEQLKKLDADLEELLKQDVPTAKPTPESQALHEKIEALRKQIAALKQQLPVETEPLKYQAEARPTAAAANGELLTLKLRYKAPDGQASKLLEFPVKDSGKTWKDSTKDYRFASAVAAYGMVLRGSQFKGLSNWALVYELAAEAKGADANGYRAEFLELIKKAEKAVKGQPPANDLP
ncbi:MAG: von Willebrand factor type A domain-containing protein [Planctomycetes bacterium]|nr:von Willebrand factor type A domain-containing protein [Planctomycetota bacterium]